MKNCKKGYYYCHTSKKCKRIPVGFKSVGPAGYLRKETEPDKDEDTETKKTNGNGNGAVSEGLFNKKSKYKPTKAVYGGEEQRKKDEKKKKIDAFMDRAMPKRTFDQLGRETDRRTGKLKETTYYKTDSKYQKKLDDDDRRHKKQDQRMKFGKFYDKAKDAKDRLRPGEVKRYDKTLKKWVSNKD